MPRLFVALRPPPEVRAALRALMTGVSGARWQSDAQLHLTLRYIGDVDPYTGDQIAAALAALCAPPVPVRLAGVGAFDRGGRVHTLWAGVTPHDALHHLRGLVDRALAAAGVAPAPGEFVPHITVARLALGANQSAAIAQWQAQHDALASTTFTFADIFLFESRQTQSGIEYRVIICRQLQY